MFWPIPLQVVECWIAILMPIPQLSPPAHSKQTPSFPEPPAVSGMFHGLIPISQNLQNTGILHFILTFTPVFSFLHLWPNKPVCSHARASQELSFCPGFVTMFALRAAHPRLSHVLHVGLLSPPSSALALPGSEGHIP